MAQHRRGADRFHGRRTSRWPCCPKSISRCSTYFRQLFRAGYQPAYRRHPGKDRHRYGGVRGQPTATCWRTSRRTARVLRLGTAHSVQRRPADASADTKQTIRLPGSEYLHAVLPERARWSGRWITCSWPATVPTRNGANILILSDRGVDENHMAIPSLLAVSALEQHLINTRQRTAVSVILETAEPRDVHHFATAAGLRCPGHQPLSGAGMRGRADRKRPSRQGSPCRRTGLHRRGGAGREQGRLQDGHFRAAVLPERPDFRSRGHPSGRDRPLFYQHCFPGGRHRAGRNRRGRGVPPQPGFRPAGSGNGHHAGFSVGNHRLRSGCDKEDHLYNPQTIVTLQRAVREGSMERFRQYTAMVDDETRPHTLRGTLEFAFDQMHARAAGRGGTCFRDREAVQDRGHVLRFHFAGGPRMSGRGHEPAGRTFQLRRGRRNGRASRTRSAVPRSSRWPPAASA